MFLIAAGALTLLVLGFVLQPLWRGKPLTGIGMVLSLAMVAGLLYTLIGTPNALDPAQRQAPDTLAGAIGQLETELKRDPTRVEGWRLLADAYAAQGHAVEARDALGKAVKLAPDDVDLLVAAAESRAMAATGHVFDAQALAMLQSVLTRQPMHQRARWFLGIAQRQAQQPAQAAKTWEPLLAIVDAKTATSLREQIDAARSDAGLSPLPASVAPAVVAASDVGLTIKVTLAPALAAKLPADATLFVIARQPAGPPMPVAARRIPATGFPITVTLGDGDSPMPTLKLSQLADVEVLARISTSGQAMPQPGDFEARPKAGKPSARHSGSQADTVELVIDHIRP